MQPHGDTGHLVDRQFLIRIATHIPCRYMTHARLKPRRIWEKPETWDAAADAQISAYGEMQDAAPSANDTCRPDVKGQFEVHSGTDPIKLIVPVQPRRGRQPSQA